MLALLALASGAGVVGLVGWSLVQTQRQERVRAELDARAAARDLAVAMRAALRSPALSELVPVETRFVVAGGIVQCDDDVGWLVPLAEAPPDAEVAERLRRAQVAEFTSRDPAAAMTIFDDLLAAATAATPSVAGRAMLAVPAAAAWHARRAGDDERVHSLLARADEQFATATAAATADSAFARAVAATTLLHAATGRVLGAERLLAASPPSIVMPVLDRLHALGADVATLRAEHERLVARRELLAAATAAMRSLPDAVLEPRVLTVGERLLLWFPEPVVGAGHGALVPREWLATLVERSRHGPPLPTDLPPLPARGDLGFAAPPPDAEELLPGVWIAAAAGPEPPWFARPTAVVGAGLLLIIVFAASAFFTLRGVRREALAMRARADL